MKADHKLALEWAADVVEGERRFPNPPTNIAKIAAAYMEDHAEVERLREALGPARQGRERWTLKR